MGPKPTPVLLGECPKCHHKFHARKQDCLRGPFANLPKVFWLKKCPGCGWHVEMKEGVKYD